jgi:deazaflavin-dependent oxidoreductase (nitroreductase family)
MSVRLTPRGTRGTRFPKMAPWARALFTAVNVTMFRIGGRRMRVQGRPLLRSWLVVASAAGSSSHPAWYLNLARRPDDVAIEVDGERVAVRAESLHGAERERAWNRVVALAPGYGKYAHDTHREIPIVRLTPKAA